MLVYLLIQSNFDLHSINNGIMFKKLDWIKMCNHQYIYRRHQTRRRSVYRVWFSY